MSIWLSRVETILDEQTGLRRIVWATTGEAIRLDPPAPPPLAPAPVPAPISTTTLVWLAAQPRPKRAPRPAQAPITGDVPSGAWLREQRMALGYSQRDLAARVGLARGYLCDLENGRRFGGPAAGARQRVAVVLRELKAAQQ